MTTVPAPPTFPLPGPGQDVVVDTARPPVPSDAAARQAAAVLDGVLAAAKALLGCELVAYNRLGPTEIVTARTRGHLPGLSPGTRVARERVHCQRMLDGAPHATTTAARDPHYGDLALTSALSLQTYVGVPVLDSRGEPCGTLCGFDRREVEVPGRTVDLLHQLASVLTPHTDGLGALDAVLRRRGGHWTVEGVDEPHTGRSLAALLAAQPVAEQTDELASLQADLVVLEAAVQERVVQEQAIGVLAERLAVPPVSAYRALRDPAPDVPLPQVARAVVASAARPAAAPRHGVRPGSPRPGLPRR